MATEIRYLCDTCHKPIDPTDKWELDVATDQMWHSRCPKPEPEELDPTVRHYDDVEEAPDVRQRQEVQDPETGAIWAIWDPVITDDEWDGDGYDYVKELGDAQPLPPGIPDSEQAWWLSTGMYP